VLWRAPTWGLERPDLVFSDLHERSTLWRAGILGAEEKLPVEAEWRREFEKAFALGYDAKRKRQCYRSADIPEELIRAWSAERKRRAKRIRRLAADAAKQEAPGSHRATLAARPTPAQ